MKVDKAVSTNEISINDLHNGIRYESILNALVEKKILAIKRDCEQTEQKLKQQRKHNCLGGLLFGKRRHQHEQQQQSPLPPPPLRDPTTDNSITKSEWPRIADTIVINECVAIGDATANDDAKNAVVLVNRNKLIENDNQQERRVVDAATTKPNEQGALSEDCGSTSTVASHSAQQTDDVGKSPPPLHSSDVLRPARKISSDTIISIPSSSKHTTFSAPSPIDQEQRRRLRVLEAKSISAQCSPIFPRQIFAGETLKLSIPQRLMSRQNTSDDIVNVTFSNVLANEDAVDGGDTIVDNVQTTSKKVQLHKKDSGKLGRCSAANDAHGFISSFNQLTSSNNLPAVISTTKLRSAGGSGVSRFQSTPVVEAARTTNASQPSETSAVQKATTSGRSSDEDEPLKTDKRKNRKCWWRRDALID